MTSHSPQIKDFIISTTVPLTGNRLIRTDKTRSVMQIEIER